MQIITSPNKTSGDLVLIISDEAKIELEELFIEKGQDFYSDDTMYEWFEDFIANSEWEWLSPEDIGALTDAPILGIRDENDKVIEAYAFMDYQVKSLMVELKNHCKAVLVSGRSKEPNPLTYIKEYCYHDDFIFFSIRTKKYDNTLKYYLNLFAEAKRHFPDLTPEHIIALEYGGDTIRGHRGIELRMNKNDVKMVPASYQYCDNFNHMMTKS